jgi:hypothetical protein
MKLRTRILAALAAATLPLAAAASAQAGTASPARAAAKVTVTVPAFTVGVSTKEVKHNITITIAGKSSDADTEVDIVFTKKGACPLNGLAQNNVGYLGNNLWGLALRVNAPALNGDCAGAVPFTITVKDTTATTPGTTVYHGTVAFHRAARFVKVNAGPEPVKKGHTVTTKALIERADWNDGKYHTYAGQKSTLEFRTSAGSYQKVKTVLARAGGRLTGSAKQRVKGCWRYIFAGTSVTSPATSTADCVAVK